MGSRKKWDPTVEYKPDLLDIGIAMDIGAFGYELGTYRGWKPVREMIREVTGGEMAIYDLIYEGGQAFAEAKALEGIVWDESEPGRWKIWDDEIIGFVKRVISFTRKGEGTPPDRRELLELARDQMRSANVSD